MAAAAFALPGCAEIAGRPKASKTYTNFVIIFCDDLGYADVGKYGAKGFQTPKLDRLADDGMRFTDFYVSQAVCSASRAALLTGCYSNHIGILGALGPNDKHGINAKEQTIAEVLKQKHYATGIFGKWHLGHHKQFLPLQNGFDEYLGLPYSNDMWPVGYDRNPWPDGHRKANYPPLPLIDGNETVQYLNTFEDQTTLTTRYTERAVNFIDKHKDEPFFLYVPHSMPHVPLGVSEKFRGKSQQGMYGDVIMEIDWSVGQITKALEKHGLENDTLVIFTSDNGPWLNFGDHAGSTGPLREGKGTMFEGGARVPCIMRWPGKIKPGTVCTKMGATIDILPTIAAIAGVPLPENKIDGVNILPLLKGDKNANPRDEYYMYYGDQLQAVRQGDWKLHLPHVYRSYKGVEPGRDGQPGPYGQGQTTLELYNLKTDIGETTNLAEKHPEIVERLTVLAEKARSELGDSLTKTANPGIRPAGVVSEQN